MDRTAIAQQVFYQRAYWQRAEELVRLTDGSGQKRTIEAARRNVGRRALKRFVKLVDYGSHGPLSIEDVTQICRRYAMWTALQKFEWGTYSPEADSLTRSVDEQIHSGIYDLDVSLRRQVESLVLSGRQDLGRAAHLRSVVAGRAGQLSAAFTVAGTINQHGYKWQAFAEEFPSIMDSLDVLLIVAGSPGW